jgi:aspartate kinase
MLLTTGEQVSIALLSMALQALGVDAVSFTGWQAGFLTEPVHQRARIRSIDASRVKAAIQEGRVPVVAGFQGITETGEITTLGRGGSDTTAVALAAAIEADQCDICTDVRGVYSADPRIIPQARKLPAISYDEMLELASLGAAVLHPRAVEYAKNYGVKLTVRSSFENVEGTIVEEEALMEKGLNVRGVAHDMHVARIKVIRMRNEAAAIARLFGSLAEENINVDIIVQSEHGKETTNVSFSVAADDMERALEVIKSLKPAIHHEDAVGENGLAKVSIVGAGMISNPGVAAQMFQVLSDAGVTIKMISTSDIKVSCVVPEQEAVRAARMLHTAFGLDVDEVTVVSR